PELLHRERRVADAVGEVVDDADARVRETELTGEDALAGDRHAHEIGVAGNEADLGLRLEARPDRLPVDAAVVQRYVRVPGPAIGHGAAPCAREAGRLVPFVALGERDAELESDEVVGRELGPEDAVPAHHGDAPHDDAQVAVASDASAEISASRSDGALSP